MISEQIKESVNKIFEQLQENELQRKLLLVQLKYIRDTCPHIDIEWWTNNDGYGQFRVERCLICGLQKDDGFTVTSIQKRTKR